MAKFRNFVRTIMTVSQWRAEVADNGAYDVNENDSKRRHVPILDHFL